MDILPNYVTGVVAILLFSSFVKIVTTLSILRFGVGLSGAGFGMAIIALSLALSLFVMQPYIDHAGGAGVVLSPDALSDSSSIDKHFRPFLAKNTNPDVLSRMKKLAKKLHQAAGPSSAGEAAPAASESVKQKDGLAVLAASFLVSELQVAFQIGFLILIPFLVVDLLVANALLVLGAEQVSHAIVSVPLKIFLFFALDGWFLVSQRLIGTYI